MIGMNDDEVELNHHHHEYGGGQHSPVGAKAPLIYETK